MVSVLTLSVLSVGRTNQPSAKQAVPASMYGNVFISCNSVQPGKRKAVTRGMHRLLFVYVIFYKETT